MGTLLTLFGIADLLVVAFVARKMASINKSAKERKYYAWAIAVGLLIFVGICYMWLFELSEAFKNMNGY